MGQAFDLLTMRRPPRFREAAYAAIKEAILAGKLAGSDPLVEERIAASLGISRTPVREALAILEHEGLIAPRYGKGLFIRALTRDEFMEMFTANEAVEPYLARRAAWHATDEHLIQMQAAIDRGRQAAVEVNLYDSLRSGRDFHHWLGTAAGNSRLTEFVVRNEEQADLYLISLGDDHLISSSHMETSNREHQNILDAIRARDPEAAARFVIVHGQSLRERLTPLLRTDAQDDGRSSLAVPPVLATRR
jgi:DNA-binding GntR family transcriptional regulator